MKRKWDMQFTWNPWLSLGIHFDHTDPSVALHLPGVILYFGRCKQPGFRAIIGPTVSAMGRITKSHKEIRDGEEVTVIDEFKLDRIFYGLKDAWKSTWEQK